MPNFYRASVWFTNNVFAPAAGVAFGPWMQEYVWKPLGDMPPDFAPGPFDNVVAIGAVGSSRLGKSFAKISAVVSKFEHPLTEALPEAGRHPFYDPKFRAAGSWNNKGPRFVPSSESGEMIRMVEDSAIPYGDTIRAINYATDSSVLTQLSRMKEAGPHNFVVVSKGSRYELRVAPQAGNGFAGKPFREGGVKHAQIANGKPIMFGGTMRVEQLENGEYFIRMMNDTGTYGKNLRITPERTEVAIDIIREAFHYQMPAGNIEFIPFQR